MLGLGPKDFSFEIFPQMIIRDLSPSHVVLPKRGSHITKFLLPKFQTPNHWSQSRRCAGGSIQSLHRGSEEDRDRVQGQV